MIMMMMMMMGGNRRGNIIKQFKEVVINPNLKIHVKLYIKTVNGELIHNIVFESTHPLYIYYMCKKI